MTIWDDDFSRQFPDGSTFFNAILRDENCQGQFSSVSGESPEMENKQEKLTKKEWKNILSIVR